MAGPFLRDDQFARIYAMLQGERRIHTKERERERRFLEAVRWINRSGA